MTTTQIALFVPRHVRASRLSPEAVAAVSASALAGALGTAGLYPQLDGGTLRFAVGGGAAILAVAVARTALRAEKTNFVALRALGMSVLLGIALAWICGVVAFAGLDLASTGVVAIFAIPLGGLTGMLYAVPLMILLASAKTAKRVRTADAAAHARRATGIAGAAACLLGVAGSSLLRGMEILAWVPLAAAGLGVVLATEAQVELMRRAAWVRRVRHGDEPFLAVRARTTADAALDVPRLTGDASVLELVPQAGAYRANAARVPLALV